MAAAAAAALAPASSSRLGPRSTARLLLICTTARNPRNPIQRPKSLERKPYLLCPSLHLHFPLTVPSELSFSNWRRFCSGTTGSLSPTEPRTESSGNPTAEAGERVREFRKRLRIVDIKGGPDEGLDRLGQRLSIRGWVRTCRVQSSVTFIEVNDGSCLSNMQCVMSSDAEGYNQVESGFITTGASVRVEGILVRSQGSKQKVELKVLEIISEMVLFSPVS